jgi:hypothetical protein
LQHRCLAVAVDPADVDVLAVVDVPMVFSGVLVEASVPAVVDASFVAGVAISLCPCCCRCLSFCYEY